MENAGRRRDRSERESNWALCWGVRRTEANKSRPLYRLNKRRSKRSLRIRRESCSRGRLGDRLPACLRPSDRTSCRNLSLSIGRPKEEKKRRPYTLDKKQKRERVFIFIYFSKLKTLAVCRCRSSWGPLVSRDPPTGS